MVRTLVTGGSGFIGSAVVRMLLAGRESVRVLTRNPHRLPREMQTPPTARNALYELRRSSILPPRLQTVDLGQVCRSYW